MIHQSVFPGVYSSGLSDMFEYLDGLKMAVVWMDKYVPI